MLSKKNSTSKRSTAQVVDHFFRHESSKITSFLVRKYGTTRIELIEDAVQDTLLKAMQTWPYNGIPDNPSGWFLTCSQNRFLDLLKRKDNSSKSDIFPEELQLIDDENGMTLPVLEHQLEDDQLAMMFACCHPSLSPEFQVILTLKILCGFGRKEIAKALLKKEDAVAKSYTRARDQFKKGNISLEVPIGKTLNERLDSVLKVIYLLFNEGYHSRDEQFLVRKALCAEAMRLNQCILSNKLLTKPKVHALMSLMAFQASRIPARVNAKGKLVILEKQDRSLWSQELIQLGRQHIKLSTGFGLLSEYHVQASIASLHCSASSYEKTDWDKILFLYDLLLKMKSNAVVSLNRIVAYGKVHGPKKALDELALIAHDKALLNNHLFFSVKGSLYEACGYHEIALEYYQSALSMVLNKTEKVFIQEKIDKIKELII